MLSHRLQNVTEGNVDMIFLLLNICIILFCYFNTDNNTLFPFFLHLGSFTNSTLFKNLAANSKWDEKERTLK